ncbi:glycosyltransferase [Tenacibaculum sp. UWU-22]|uniref:glycosyltransferase n=1 Tax=Tenacibaculum sp. UWU-22 TaxID=3234187 RepID=UPI0034DB0AFE
MKVLHVIPTLEIGGAETLLVKSIPYYLKNNIKVDILVFKRTDSFLLKELETKYNIFVLGISSVYSPLCVFKMLKYINKYDIVHTHLSTPLYWSSIAKTILFSRTNLVHTEHNTENKRRGNFFLKIIECFIYSKFKKVISISNQTNKNLKRHLNLLRKKSFYEVVLNGVDLIEIKNSRTSNLRNLLKLKNKKLIIQVSNFTKQKDQKTVIKAFSILPSDYYLALVGEGPTKTECISLVEKLDLRDRVRFLGKRSDVYKLFKACDLSVQSSHYEGFGLVAVEAMACGKPVVASNVKGLSDVVNGAGILFKKGDYKELAFHVRELIENREHYRSVSEACLERSKMFSIEKMVNEYVKIYKEI